MIARYLVPSVARGETHRERRNDVSNVQYPLYPKAAQRVGDNDKHNMKKKNTHTRTAYIQISAMPLKYRQCLYITIVVPFAVTHFYSTKYMYI